MNFGFSSGERAVELRFEIPEASRVLLHDYAVSPKGFVLTGAAISPQGARAGYVAYLERSGATRLVVRVDPFEPTSVAACADGSVWLLGSIPAGESPSIDHDIVQRFDAEGRRLGTHVRASSFRKAAAPFHPGVQDEYSPSRIRCYDKGVLVISTAGDEIVMLNSNGSETARVPLARPGLGAEPPPGILRGEDGRPIPHGLLGGFAVDSDGTLYGDYLVTSGEALFRRPLTDAGWTQIPTDESGTVIGVHAGRAVRLNVRTKTLLTSH